MALTGQYSVSDETGRVRTNRLPRRCRPGLRGQHGISTDLARNGRAEYAALPRSGCGHVPQRGGLLADPRHRSAWSPGYLPPDNLLPRLYGSFPEVSGPGAAGRAQELPPLTLAARRFFRLRRSRREARSRSGDDGLSSGGSPARYRRRVTACGSTPACRGSPRVTGWGSNSGSARDSRSLRRSATRWVRPASCACCPET
jgi:hypothetical protein